MPTDLQIMYAAAREGDPVKEGTSSVGKALGAAGARKPRGHHAALRFMARQTGIDEATIDRCLKRARRADVLEEKRGNRRANDLAHSKNVGKAARVSS